MTPCILPSANIINILLDICFGSCFKNKKIKHGTIKTIPISWEGKIGKFRQVMLKENGHVASEIDLVFGFFDIRERGLIDPPKDWFEAIGMD